MSLNDVEWPLNGRQQNASKRSRCFLCVAELLVLIAEAQLPIIVVSVVLVIVVLTLLLFSYRLETIDPTIRNYLYHNAVNCHVVPNISHIFVIHSFYSYLHFVIEYMYSVAFSDCNEERRNKGTFYVGHEFSDY